MDGEGDFDPRTEDMGAKGGGNDDAQDLSLPGGPGDPPSPPVKPPGSKLGGLWDEITGKRKGPYHKLPQDDKGTPMTTFPPEKKGLPSTSKDAEETSFIEGGPSGRVLTAKDIASLEVEKDFPNLDRNQVDHTIK